jgi:hypothetical protein
MPTVQNDTYGEITRDELRQLRATASRCIFCGLLADVDPRFHAARYGHSPIRRVEGRRERWTGTGWTPDAQ